MNNSYVKNRKSLLRSIELPFTNILYEIKKVVSVSIFQKPY